MQPTSQANHGLNTFRSEHGLCTNLSQLIVVAISRTLPFFICVLCFQRLVVPTSSVLAKLCSLLFVSLVTSRFVYVCVCVVGIVNLINLLNYYFYYYIILLFVLFSVENHIRTKIFIQDSPIEQVPDFK